MVTTGGTADRPPCDRARRSDPDGRAGVARGLGLSRTGRVARTPWCPVSR
jgi:hypothetical protein